MSSDGSNAEMTAIDLAAQVNCFGSGAFFRARCCWHGIRKKYLELLLKYDKVDGGVSRTVRGTCLRALHMGVCTGFHALGVAAATCAAPVHTHPCKGRMPTRICAAQAPRPRHAGLPVPIMIMSNHSRGCAAACVLCLPCAAGCLPACARRFIRR